jgi:phospholipid transport system substrate-binding protein
MKYFLTFIVTLVLLTTSLHALQEEDISSFMKTNIDATTVILRDTSIPKAEKAPKIFAIFDSVFDYTLMAKLSIVGKQWESIGATNQERFAKAFEAKLKQSYMEKLDLYTDEKIVIKNSEKIKDARIHLTTHLMRNSEVYEIIYKFYKNKSNEWLIYDVDILGVSIIQTYRTQFADILAKDSFEQLLVKLK